MKNIRLYGTGFVVVSLLLVVYPGMVKSQVMDYFRMGQSLGNAYSEGQQQGLAAQQQRLQNEQQRQQIELNRQAIQERSNRVQQAIDDAYATGYKKGVDDMTVKMQNEQDAMELKAIEKLGYSVWTETSVDELKKFKASLQPELLLNPNRYANKVFLNLIDARLKELEPPPIVKEEPTVTKKGKTVTKKGKTSP